MSNTNTSATAKALVAVTEIPAAKRGRPVGSGPWNDFAEQVIANPGQTFQYPEAVAPGTAQYLRKRYGLNITTRAAGNKRVNMFMTSPPPTKKARKPRNGNTAPDAQATATPDLPVVNA